MSVVSLPQATSLHREDTVYSADALEFSQHDLDVFAVATYQIVPPPPPPSREPGNADSDSDDEPPPTPAAKRKGRCLVYQVDDAGSARELFRTEDGPAILDLRWDPHRHVSHGPILTMANAEGQLVQSSYSASESRLEHLKTLQIAESKTLVLSLDYSNRLDPSRSGDVITSLSSGDLALAKIGEDGLLEEGRTWKAHDYEPWVAAWDCWSEGVAYSGGDDCTFKAWDIRGDCERPIWQNKTLWDAGVTCIQTSPHVPNIVAVGSYNETITFLDPRNPSQALSSLAIGGGAWRIKWHPSLTRKNDILVACMHDGFKIVSMADGFDEGEIVREFRAHESLAYGCDWSREEGEDEGSLVGSCSFYDHEMRVWRA